MSRLSKPPSSAANQTAMWQKKSSGMVSRCFQIQWGIFRKRGRAIAARIPLNCNFRRPPWEFAESRNRHQLHSPMASSATSTSEVGFLGMDSMDSWSVVRTNFLWKQNNTRKNAMIHGVLSTSNMPWRISLPHLLHSLSHFFAHDLALRLSPQLPQADNPHKVLDGSDPSVSDVSSDSKVQCEISLKRIDPSPKTFQVAHLPRKKRWILRHPCSPGSAPAAHPFQPPLVANPSPLHREHVVLTLSQSAGPRSIVSWSLRFFLVFSMGFPPEKGT